MELFVATIRTQYDPLQVHFGKKIGWEMSWNIKYIKFNFEFEKIKTAVTSKIRTMNLKIVGKYANPSNIKF